MKTLSRQRMGSEQGEAGGGELIRYKGQAEEVTFRMPRTQPCETPRAGKSQAGVRKQETGSLELVKGKPSQR